jgi:3-phenylpropionate/trans-cinnamate dioxygenase ferredoxin subunit
VSSEGYVPLCNAADIPPGTTGDFQVGGKSVLVANCEGTFHAIEDRCTHDDGPLAEGRLSRCQVECPRHGARFDLKTGRALTLPAVRPVRAFEVRVTGEGVVEVRL